MKIAVLDDLCACIWTICHSYVVDHKLCLNLNLRCMCSSSSEHCYCHTVFFASRLVNALLLPYSHLANTLLLPYLLSFSLEFVDLNGDELLG